MSTFLPFIAEELKQGYFVSELDTGFFQKVSFISIGGKSQDVKKTTQLQIKAEFTL